MSNLFGGLNLFCNRLRSQCNVPFRSILTVALTIEPRFCDCNLIYTVIYPVTDDLIL